MVDVLLYDPTADAPTQARPPNPKLPDLRGKVIGFQIGWSRFEMFMDRIEQLLREKSEVKDVIRVPARSAAAHGGRQGEEARNWETFKSRVDCAVLGLGA